MRARAIVILLGVSAALGAAGGCSSDRSEGTNANWVACEVEADCAKLGAGYGCVNGRCAPSGTDGGRDATDRDGSRDATSDRDATHQDAAPQCVTSPPQPDDTWSRARESLPECVLPFVLPEIIQLRCGELDAVTLTGIDSSHTRYYDGTGKLVGGKNTGLTTLPECVSYDPSFSSAPGSCVRITPPCRDGGSPDAGEPDGSGGDGAPRDGAPLDGAGACPLESLPACSDGGGCMLRWEVAVTRVPSCYTGSFSPASRGTCGPYDAVVLLMFDASSVYFYSAAGDLVGQTGSFFGQTECTAYVPSFTSAPDCTFEPVPECP